MICFYIRSLYISLSGMDSGLCIYRLFMWSNFNFLHSSKWITLPTQSCLVLYSFYANLLHLLIMWLIISSLSSRNLHLLFLLHLIYPCFDMIGPYGIVLFEEIQFLSEGFPFIAISTFSRVRCHLLRHPKSCFSSHVWFLVISILLILVSSVLFLVLVISLPPHFSM